MQGGRQEAGCGLQVRGGCTVSLVAGKCWTRRKRLDLATSMREQIKQGSRLIWTWKSHASSSKSGHITWHLKGWLQDP